MKTNIAVLHPDGTVQSITANVDLLKDRHSLMALWSASQCKIENENLQTWQKYVCKSGVKMAVLFTDKWQAYEVRQVKINGKFVNKLKTIHI